MARNPIADNPFQYRKYIVKGDRLEGYISPQLKKSFDYVSAHGVSARGITSKELKPIANPLIREAKLRVRELERAGLTDAPAYRYIKDELKYLTASGNDLNSIRRGTWLAFNFLKAETSTVEGARHFIQETTDRMVGRKTTYDEREIIWDLFHRLETRHEGYFLSKQYGSGDLSDDINVIEQVLQRAEWDLDLAISMLESDADIQEAQERLKTDDEYVPDEVILQKAKWSEIKL